MNSCVQSENGGVGVGVWGRHSVANTEQTDGNLHKGSKYKKKEEIGLYMLYKLFIEDIVLYHSPSAYFLIFNNAQVFILLSNTKSCFVYPYSHQKNGRVSCSIPFWTDEQRIYKLKTPLRPINRPLRSL